MNEFADLVIANANIITMDEARPRATALAVTAGVICAVGTADDVVSVTGPETETLDLKGQVLLPGFVEAHGHVLLMGQLLGDEILDVRSFQCPTWQDVEAAVKQRIGETEPGQPVVAFGYDTVQHNVVAPTRQDLDALTTEHPLVLISLSAHNASANSAAIDLVGLTGETPDPQGGEFGRAADGSLDGRFNEAGAVAVLAIPLYGLMKVDVVASVRAQCAVMAGVGFTTVGELLVLDFHRPLLAGLAAGPELPVRLRLYEGTNDSLAPVGSKDDANPEIRQIGLKLWVDGTPLAGTILMDEPYLDTPVTRKLGLAPGCCGSANYTAEQLQTIVRAYAPSGFQFACHVQGDAAVERILDVYEQVLTEQGLLGTDHRWRLEHCGEMTPAQFSRAERLGVSCSMFSRHLYYFGDMLAEDILGPERGEHWMRLRSALDSGMKLSLHNDGYFTPPDPLGSVQSAVTRVVQGSGRVFAPEERITMHEAMRAVTIDAAWHVFSEHEVGSIEVGKLADFVELSADPYDADPMKLTDEVKVLSTWKSGHRVFSVSGVSGVGGA